MSTRDPLIPTSLTLKDTSKNIQTKLKKMEGDLFGNAQKYREQLAT
jgi:hypothetical protein